ADFAGQPCAVKNLSWHSTSLWSFEKLKGDSIASPRVNERMVVVNSQNGGCVRPGEARSELQCSRHDSTGFARHVGVPRLQGAPNPEREWDRLKMRQMLAGVPDPGRHSHHADWLCDHRTPLKCHDNVQFLFRDRTTHCVNLAQVIGVTPPLLCRNPLATSCRISGSS